MQSNQEALEPELINSYALVAYVPGPLGKFLDELRVQLVPSCVALSHVTILPPRELSIPPDQAKREIERELADFAPFRVELQDIEVFASTHVIYLSIGAGADQLRQMHDHLNRAGLFFKENYEYHPHLTLALDFPPQEIEEMAVVARERWREASLPRSFVVEALTFVQNTNQNHWQDLQAFPLGEPVPAGMNR
jgi:2'-5' RNA ligase